MKTLQNNKLKIEYDAVKGGIKRLILKDDQYALNWIKSGSGLFGSMYGESNVVTVKYEPNLIEATYYYHELEVVCRISMDENCAYMDYEFTNKQLSPLTFGTGEIGVFAPFNDSYTPFSKEHQLTKKCHAHIWCGESSSYIYALRMNGEENNFGVQIVGGQIADYAIIRKMQINDRGDFVLLFRPFTINPLDKLHLKMKLFSFRNEESFYEKAKQEEAYLDINLPKYTYRINEEIEIELDGKNLNTLNVMCDNLPITVDKIADSTYFINGKFESPGIKRFKVKYNNHTTHFEINIIENELDLIDKRLRFIVEEQQITDTNDSKYGAYYLYDFNEDKKFTENKAGNNRNLGRDRVCMPIAILARLLSKFEIDGKLKQQLQNSIMIGMDFIDKNIVKDNGVVCDTAHYKYAIKENWNNYSWYALLYTLMYEFTNDRKYLDKALKIVYKFYEKGGVNTYVSELPVLKLIELCKANNYVSDADMLKNKYMEHIDTIMKHGNHFPHQEVKFSDTTVAAAIDILLDAYELTGEEKYLIESKKMFKVLMAFCGKQPSVFMHDAPIRHWEGYVFGHSKLYGDTFPSIWGVATAKALSRYSASKEKPIYQSRANNILFNTLMMYNENKASCAYIYPYKINSYTGKRFDLWANNQDWIIYYNLIYNTSFNK